MSFSPWPFQTEALYSVLNYFKDNATGNPVVCMPTGCHAKGTKILMYDGSVKIVEDVKIGDKLMGPDSEPRTVLNLARGNEQMVRIVPTKGESFEVNISHILSLYKVNERSENSGRIYESTEPALCNISIKDYLQKSAYFKHLHKIRRAGVEFQNKSFLPLPPYFIGLFLGDGGYSANTVNFTSMDEVLMDYVKELILSTGDTYSTTVKKNNKAYSIQLRREKRDRTKKPIIATHLERLSLQGVTSGTKFVPTCYKITTRQNRLEVLAGLIDTDGHLDGHMYDYITKSKLLALDVVFIARSLGFAAYVKSCKKASQTGFVGDYFRVSISGNVIEIPCRLPHKRAMIRNQKKGVLITSFKTEILPNNDFYGFALDKDHLYLTSDFVVHHNTGKGSLIAMLIDYILYNWPNQRILQLVHTKELVQQNYNDLLMINALSPAGIYCAGLDRKESANSVVFGSLGSVRTNAEAFGFRDLILIDEGHAVSPDEETGYRQIEATLRLINPNIRVVAFTATDYRLGQGKLTDGDNPLFTDVCFDITKLHSFNRLISEGYLSPLIVPSQLKTQLDVSGVAISKGEFNQGQLQKAVDKQEITYAAIQEAVRYGYDRNCWLVFASGIEHCEHISDMLQSFGISSSFVHSKISDDERDERLAAFKEGKIKAIVGFRILTTGFNHPPIDLIIDLYPTVSPVMHVQKNGRGTRTYNGNNPNFPYIKSNCLVLDFSGNTKRIGPVNDPIIPKKKGDKTGDVPVKICAACGLYNHCSARYCGGHPEASAEGCGAEFEFQTKLLRTAGTAELIKGDYTEVQYETYDVTKVIYHKHQKIDKKPCIKVSYYSGILRFTEYEKKESYEGHPYYVNPKLLAKALRIAVVNQLAELKPILYIGGNKEVL